MNNTEKNERDIRVKFLDYMIIFKFIEFELNHKETSADQQENLQKAADALASIIWPKLFGHTPQEIAKVSSEANAILHGVVAEQEQLKRHLMLRCLINYEMQQKDTSKEEREQLGIANDSIYKICGAFLIPHKNEVAALFLEAAHKDYFSRN